MYWVNRVFGHLVYTNDVIALKVHSKLPTKTKVVFWIPILFAYR